MSDDLYKFLFLGVMIIGVIFGHRGAVVQKIVTTSGELLAQKTSQLPTLFVLTPPHEAIDKLEAAVSSQLTQLQPLVVTPRPVFGEARPSGRPEPAVLSATSFADQQSPQSYRDTLQAESNLGQGAFFKNGSEPPPVTLARIALVADLESGEHLFARESERRWPIASIAKLMFAVIALRNVDQNQVITITQNDFPIGVSENGLKIGESYSVKDFLLSALLESTNESVEAIARVYGREAFIAQMNAQAEAWGLEDTHFSDPTGLSVATQSSAEDMLAFAKNIYENYPDIFRLTQKPTAVITELISGRAITIKAINLFAGQPEFLGGKTGFTDEAGGNLLSIFLYRERPVVIIVLGSEDRFGDSEKLLGWLKRNYK
jgi:D-alanyl-D-alanine carboxypeptidase